jgi:hypothetical protein
MGGASVRLRVTALRQMAEQIASDEPNDVRFLLDNLDRMRDRWARKNQGKPSTINTYASKAKTTIEEFLRWAESPGRYEPKKAGAKPAPRPEPKAPKANASAAAPTPAASVVTPTLPPVVQSDAGARICDLGGGRLFRYQRPADGLKVKDAIRVAFHIITTCDDYDPTISPMQVVSTALQRT